MSNNSLLSPVRVGVLDGGIAATAGIVTLERAAFDLDDSGTVAVVEGDNGDLSHGTGVAGIIAAGASEIELLDAQVFRRGHLGIPAVVAAGLDWLVRRRARLVNMSFGLLSDREVLRVACRAALAQGVVLVASSPAQGRTVFPAAYPGVIRVTGDARCAAGEISWLGNERADFGACVGGGAHRPHQAGQGASLAAAHFSAALANALSQFGDGGVACTAMRAACRYVGAEQRSEARSRPVDGVHGDQN